MAQIFILAQFLEAHGRKNDDVTSGEQIFFNENLRGIIFGHVQSQEWPEIDVYEERLDTTEECDLINEAIAARNRVVLRHAVREGDFDRLMDAEKLQILIFALESCLKNESVQKDLETFNVQSIDRGVEVGELDLLELLCDEQIGYLQKVKQDANVWLDSVIDEKIIRLFALVTPETFISLNSNPSQRPAIRKFQAVIRNEDNKLLEMAAFKNPPLMKYMIENDIYKKTPDEIAEILKRVAQASNPRVTRKRKAISRRR